MKEGGRASQQPAPLPTGRECPICGKPATKESDPFCSKRCAHIDLNRWLKGSYVIPARAEDDEEDDAAEAKG